MAITEVNGAQVQDPRVVAKIALTGKTAAISQTGLYTPPVEGQYRVSIVQRCTVTGTGNVNTTIYWHNGVASDSSVPMSATTLNSTTARANSVQTIHAGPSAAIGYSTAYTSTGTYALDIVVEKLQ